MAKKKSTNVSNEELDLQVTNDDVVTLELEDDEEWDLEFDLDLDSNEQSDEDDEVTDTDEDDSDDVDEFEIDLSGDEDDYEIPLDALDMDSESEDEANDDRTDEPNIDLTDDDLELELPENEFDVDFESSDETEEVDNDKVSSPPVNVLSILKMASFGIGDIKPSITKVVNRFPNAGVASLVNSEKNGKRFILSREVHEKLGEPESVQVGYKDNQIIISERIADNYTSYGLKRQGAKQIIYNKELVEQMTDLFELDFSARTCITFSEVSYENLNDAIIAIITVT